MRLGKDRSDLARELAEVGLILAPSFRSRAYVQMLVARGLRPGLVIHIPGREAEWHGPADVLVNFGANVESLLFRPGEPARATAAQQGWPAHELTNPDVNSPESIDEISALTPHVMVYSGLAKVLLKERLLATGKRFLHVHGGYVPAYRAATAFYFGLLREGRLGESAIWLDEGIDTGPVLMREWYEPISGLDVDRIQDPVARADLLIRVLRHRCDTGSYPETPTSGPSETHFIIHPVLKHLALRRLAPWPGDPPARSTGTRHV